MHRPINTRKNARGNMNYLSACLIDFTVNAMLGTSEKKYHAYLEEEYQKEIEAEQKRYEKELEQLRLNRLMEEYLEELEAENREDIPIKELFKTGCGDIAVQAFFRDPELNVVINILEEDDIHGPYFKKVLKDKTGYYFKLDGEKWYFQKKHKELEK